VWGGGCGPSSQRAALSVHNDDLDHRGLVDATASARGVCRKVHEVWLGAAGAADIRDAQGFRAARNVGFPQTIRAVDSARNGLGPAVAERNAPQVGRTKN